MPSTSIAPGPLRSFFALRSYRTLSVSVANDVMQESMYLSATLRGRGSLPQSTSSRSSETANTSGISSAACIVSTILSADALIAARTTFFPFIAGTIFGVDATVSFASRYALTLLRNSKFLSGACWSSGARDAAASQVARSRSADLASFISTSVSTAAKDSIWSHMLRSLVRNEPAALRYSRSLDSCLSVLVALSARLPPIMAIASGSASP